MANKPSKSSTPSSHLDELYSVDHMLELLGDVNRFRNPLGGVLGGGEGFGDEDALGGGAVLLST